MTSPPCIRVGFIGAGGIVERHIGILREMNDVAITAFSDPDLERAGHLAELSGARAYGTYEEMLAQEVLDAVFICIPPFAHGEPERAVMRAGLPFFVEKPISLDWETGKSLAHDIAKQNIVTAVGYHWRYLDTVQEAKTLLINNPPQLLSGYWLDQTPPPLWWRQQDRSGGQIIEQATHIIDLARYLVGEVTEVYARTCPGPERAEFPGLTVATSSVVTLRFETGVVGSLATTCLLKWPHRIGLCLFSDGLAIELSDREIMVDVGRGRPVRVATSDPVWQQDRDFIDAVAGKKNHIRCSYAEALETHRVALAIVHSAETGRAVPINRKEDCHA